MISSFLQLFRSLKYLLSLDVHCVGVFKPPFSFPFSFYPYFCVAYSLMKKSVLVWWITRSFAIFTSSSLYIPRSTVQPGPYAGQDFVLLYCGFNRTAAILGGF